MKRLLVVIAASAVYCSVGLFAQGSAPLRDVLKDPAKFVNQKTCWVGRAVGGAALVEDPSKVVFSYWMALDEKGTPVKELVFTVDEDSATRSPAATSAERIDGDRVDRLVCGVIVGTRNAYLSEDGKGRVVEAPFLRQATIELRPLKGK